MQSVDLHIDQVRLQADAGAARAGELGPVLRQAFQLLAERLQEKSPFGRFNDPGPIALNELRVGALSVDELLAANGAERLADELFDSITKEAR